MNTFITYLVLLLATTVTSKSTSITVYHVNPSRYPVMPINMDTADRNGDMFFSMRSIVQPIECANDPSSHDCTNVEVTSNSLVITKLILEVELPYGPYGRCNICVNGTDSHGDNNCTNGKYICNCGSWGTVVPCLEPVGFLNVTKDFSKRKCSDGAANWECWHDNIATKTGGLWYSTTDNGYNKTWSVQKVLKRVNKTCSDNTINTVIETHGASIFQHYNASVGKHRNTSSTKWITSWYETVLGKDAGKPNGTVSGLDLLILEKAWDAPFDSNDETKGGCPDLLNSVP